MGQWDIEFAKRKRAAFERAKAQQRELVEQLELRACAAEAEAKLRAAEVKGAADKKAPGPKRWKRDLAVIALKAVSNGCAPTSKTIGRAHSWLVENHPDKAGQISDDTIRRAAGLK